MALFVSAGGHVTAIAFVEFSGLLKAGHATQPRCSADTQWCREGEPMSTTYYVYTLSDHWAALLRDAGQAIPEGEPSRHPTIGEVRAVLSAFDDYTVDEQRRGEYWSADVRPIRPSPGSGTTVLVNGVRDDTVPHPIMFEGGDPELMVAALERLARTCGVLILRAETSYRALVVRAGSDPRAVLEPWRVPPPA